MVTTHSTASDTTEGYRVSLAARRVLGRVFDRGQNSSRLGIDQYSSFFAMARTSGVGWYCPRSAGSRGMNRAEVSSTRIRAIWSHRTP